MNIVKRDSKFNKKQIRDIAKVNMGQSPSSESYVESDNLGVPFFQGVAEFGNKVPTVKVFTNDPRKKSKKREVLFSVRAPVGRVNMSPYDCAIGRGLCSFNSNDNNEYLYFLLKSLDGKWKRFSQGGIYQSINRDALLDVEVPYPENIDEIEKIANFLSERESYLQSIQTLISKVEQRNQYYLHGLTSGELAIKDGITFENDENTNEVVLNGKTKEVPASFDEFKLGDIIQEENKSKLAVKDAIEGEYPFFNCSETLSMTHNDYLVDGNYIIMSTGGKPSIHYYEGKMAYSSDSYVISTTDNVNSRYLAFLLKANMKRIERCFLGSGLKHLNKKIFKKEVYHLPDLDKQKEVADFLSKNEDEVNLVRELYSKEKQVFQWLCEKLVSGEYRIEE